jgi:hypothetical protein
MNLYEASEQWATRPPDERFASVAEMLKACQKYYANAAEASLAAANLKAVADEKEVKLLGQKGNESKLTYWAFGQLAHKANAPANYLRTLPTTVAAECLNFGFKRFKESNASLELMFRQLPDSEVSKPKADGK